jgi:hypothetical protein
MGNSDGILAGSIALKMGHATSTISSSAAARLTEDPKERVLLLEESRDFRTADQRSWGGG